jgi:hypothetical protein
MLRIVAFSNMALSEITSALVSARSCVAHREVRAEKYGGLA